MDSQLANIDSPKKNIKIEVDFELLFRRFLEIIPGASTWLTLIVLTALAFILPTWIALFLILYDLYWLVRAFYISTYLIASYNQLKVQKGIDWEKRLNSLEDLAKAKEDTAKKITDLLSSLKKPDLTKKERKNKKLIIKQEKDFLSNLNELTKKNVNILPWKKVINVVIIPTYKESFAVLKTTLDHLKETTFPKENLWVVVAFEERAGAEALEIKKITEENYKNDFGLFLTTVHPDGIRGEMKVKSANATWAAKEIKKILDQRGVDYENVLISNFDSDTCVGPEFFSYLTYVYVTTPDRTFASYQPLPLYHNNIWDAPAFTRVIATNSAFWQMIEAVRPERLVTFSSHSMSFKALVNVDFWEVDVVSEDSRIFWQCFLKNNGNYRTIPLFTNVSMDATLAPTLWRTFVNQYKQKRRWAWGIENFPYLAEQFSKNKKIPFIKKFKCLWMIFEGNHSWATSSIIIATLGWIPVLFGNPQFQQTVLSYNLPFITRSLMTLAMLGLVVTMSLTLILLPPPPPNTPKRKYVYMILQWALVPFIASILGSFPAIDAQTRLMIGKPLGFWVTEKTRIENK